MPQTPQDERPLVRVVLRGVAEQWVDENIAAVYRGGAIVPSFGLVVPIIGPVSVEVGGGYTQSISRTAREAAGAEGEGGGDPRRFHLAPISLLGFYTFDPKTFPVDVFAGAGPTFTAFHEQFPVGSVSFEEDPEGHQRGAVSGVKLGLEVRAGLRIDLGLVSSTRTWPPRKGVPRKIELELFGAKRFGAAPKVGKGFDFNAWRGGVGLAVGF